MTVKVYANDTPPRLYFHDIEHRTCSVERNYHIKISKYGRLFYVDNYELNVLLFAQLEIL